MSARKSARLADKAKPSYKYNILSSKRNSDSELVAHHPRENTVLPQHSDIDGSHGEGSRSSRPRQTKKRRIDSEGSEESETSLFKTLGAPRKTGKHTNVKWEQSSPALKIVQDSGTQENSTDLSEPPDKPIRTDFDTQKPVQPSRLDNAPESDDSALTTDCVVLSSQLHERNEALLFYDNEDCQSPDSPCQTRSTEYVDAARSSPDLEDVSLPDMEFEAFDWDVEPGQELAACRETPSEIRLIETQELRNGDRADSSSAEDRGYVTAEEQVHFTPSPKPLMVSGANDDTAQPVREISESKLDYKRRQLDEQLAEFHRQEAAKTDLLTLTEGADSSDDDDLAEMLSRLKPRAKAPTVRRELRQRHPIQAKSINTPVAVLKSKEIEALEKVEAKERIRAQAMEYSKLSDQGDTSLASHRSFETNRDIIAPRLGEEFEDLGGLLGADVSQHTDVHLSIWRQLSEADYHRGPITDICQAIFGQVSTQQLRRKSFADWRDEIYRCADDLCAGRAAADNLIVPLISASYDLPSYGLELVRRAVRPALSGLQPSSKTNMIQHLANMMDEQDTEYFDAHVFGMLDGHRPFTSWLSLKLLHPGLELSKVDLSTEPCADLLLSLMETEQVSLNRKLSLSQTGDGYRSVRRQSRQLASHWHDLSILFQGYQTTTTRRQSLKDWLSRADLVLSELLGRVATRADETFDPKRAQVRETLSLLQSRIQRQICDLLTNCRADLSGGLVETEDLLESSLKYHPPEEFPDTNMTSLQKPQPKSRAKQNI